MSASCFVVTIDGPAGAGKSTVARRVAAELELGYLDTGALYRTVALAASERGLSLEDGPALGLLASGLDVEMPAGGAKVLLEGRDISSEIRTPAISQAASRVSALPEVRSALVTLQRAAARPPGTVAEGRDMGTVIFPEADLKVFLDADAEERARRRTVELQARAGESAELEREGVNQEQVKREILERDQRDRSREVAPLAAADDAMVVDSTGLSVDAVVATVVKEALSRRFPS